MTLTMNPDDRVQHLRFMSNVAEALTRVANIITEREKEYNDGTPIQQVVRSPFSAKQLADIKFARIESQLNSWIARPEAAGNEGLQDSILDAIAYLTFLYAWTEEPRNDETWPRLPDPKDLNK